MARVAIIGAGAVGGYYGARLAQAGHEVHFLLRRDFEAVRAHGLNVRSKDGDFHLDAPLVHRDSVEIGPVDWVLCALKATALEEARALIAPCVGEDTRVLLVMNGLGLEERFAGWFGAARIFGGLAFTCINRDADGVIHHTDYGDITLAHFLDVPTELEAALALWQGANVRATTAPSLLRARWWKLLWNIPFNGLAVTSLVIATDRIMGTPDLRAAAETLMREVAAAGNADLEAHSQQPLDAEREVAEMLAMTERMVSYRSSTVIDFIEGRSMEVDAIFGEPLRRARALGVAVPYLSLVTAQMGALDATARSRGANA